MLQTIDQTLYTDPQTDNPAGFCCRCGSEVWSAEGSCSRCGEEEDHDPA